MPGSGPEERRYHNYYMWVPYLLFLQSVSFYLPHWIWKVVQTDKVRGILQVRGDAWFSLDVLVFGEITDMINRVYCKLG